MHEKTSVSSGQILDKEADLLRTFVADNTALVGSALTRDRGFLNRLFPGPEDRLVRDHGLDQMKAGFDYRRQALRMAIDTKLQAIEEMCNHVLVTGKSEIRRQRQEFFAEQRLKLERAMNDCADRFNDDMERRLDSLSRCANPHLRQREEERLLRNIDHFHAMLEQLARGFMDIIQEGVSR